MGATTPLSWYVCACHLFIGAAFFLQYSIEHDLISPPMRIGIGLVVGASAVLIGDVIRGKADRAGQALGGAGIATLYASLLRRALCMS